MDDGIGFAKIAALGNEIDLDEAELLEFLGRDPETKVIAMLLNRSPTAAGSSRQQRLS
jgi:acyl-CoA synthetase (NDP forming)